MRFLITDLNIVLNGHKFGFVQNLIEYIKKYNTTDEFYIYTNFSKEFKLNSYDLKNVTLLNTSENEEKQRWQIKGALKTASYQWNLMLSQINKFKIDHLVLMELDLYQFEIGKKKSDFTISGIWFRPYARLMPEGNTLKDRLQNKITIRQKKIVMNFALRNKNLRKVFILNDENMPIWLNKKEPRFFYLADPCFVNQQLENFNLREKYQIPANNLILLQFGCIDPRKNTETFIEALNGLNLEQITLLVCGKFEKNYAQKLNELKNKNTKYQLVLHDNFLPDDEMESTFDQSDVIIRTNINFYSSSGVVGIAAMHNKACIVSNYGVMAEQIEKYKVGQMVDPTDIEAIKSLILTYLNYPEKRTVDGSAYRKSHTLEIFASTLLNPS